MNKLVGGLVVFAILAALALGLVAGEFALTTAPAVIEARALQEVAAAESMAAQADRDRAGAAEAWARVESARAFARAWSSWAPWFVMAVWVAFAVLVVGLALALVSWAGSRAALRVVRGPAGPVLAYAKGGRLLVLDTSRSLGGLALLDELGGGLQLPVVGDVDSAAALASQSLAAGVIATVAGGDVGARADVVERVGAGLHAVMGSLSLPGFGAREALPVSSSTALASTAPAGPALRFIKVRSPLVREREAAELDARDLRYFIAEGQAHGYGRAYWVGQTLASGRRCTRARWTWLSGTVDAAGVLADGPNNSRVLAVPLDEAYSRLELGTVGQVAGVADEE